MDAEFRNPSTKISIGDPDKNLEVVFSRQTIIFAYILEYSRKNIIEHNKIKFVY